LNIVTLLFSLLNRSATMIVRRNTPRHLPPPSTRGERREAGVRNIAYSILGGGALMQINAAWEFRFSAVVGGD
jgi:hypothetical protein